MFRCDVAFYEGAIVEQKQLAEIDIELKPPPTKGIASKFALVGSCKLVTLQNLISEWMDSQKCGRAFLLTTLNKQ